MMLVRSAMLDPTRCFLYGFNLKAHSSHLRYSGTKSHLPACLPVCAVNLCVLASSMKYHYNEMTLNYKGKLFAYFFLAVFKRIVSPSTKIPLPLYGSGLLQLLI